VNKRIGINNIRRVLSAATQEEMNQGLAWYRDARIFCRRMAKTYDISLDVAIGVLSALSPRNKWENNLRDAENVMKACKAGLGPSDVTVTTFTFNKEKAFRIIRENAPILSKTSNKTASFFDNIRNPQSNELTVDIHAFSIFMGFRAENGTLTDTHYEAIADAYRRVAKREGYRPYEVQAITWVAWKRLTAKHVKQVVPPRLYHTGIPFRVAA
jgi:hypothetical protein